MPLRKYILTGSAVFLLAITIGISTNPPGTTHLRASPQDIDRQIGVILSLIDPINHGRTSQMHLENYLDAVESGQPERAAASLKLAKALLVKADVAFAAFIQTDLLAGEAKLRECYRVSYLRLRQQGMAALFSAAERHSREDFAIAQLKVLELREQFEKYLSGELMLHESYSRQLNDTPGDNDPLASLAGISLSPQ